MREDLNLLHLEMAQRWGELLQRQGRLFEAVRVLSRAAAHEPLDFKLNRTLYRVYLEMGETVKARLLLQKYEQDLASEGFSAAEIADTVDRFWQRNE